MSAVECREAVALTLDQEAQADPFPVPGQFKVNVANEDGSRRRDRRGQQRVGQRQGGDAGAGVGPDFGQAPGMTWGMAPILHRPLTQASCDLNAPFPLLRAHT